MPTLMNSASMSPACSASAVISCASVTSVTSVTSLTIALAACPSAAQYDGPRGGFFDDEGVVPW